jgi:hypothetical protein
MAAVLILLGGLVIGFALAAWFALRRGPVARAREHFVTTGEFLRHGGTTMTHLVELFLAAFIGVLLAALLTYY